MKIPRTEILLAGVFSLIAFSLGSDGGKRELMSKNKGRGITVEEYRRGERQIREAERKGEVSKKDADKRLIEMRKAIAREDKTKNKSRGITVEEYRRGERKIREAERKGEVSKKDADKRLIEMRKAITSVNKEAKKKGHDERGVKYRAAEEKIWTAVKDGKLSEEGAQKRLGAIKKQIWADKGKEQNRAEKFRAAEEKIWATVKAGKLSKKDAGEKLAVLKKEMFGGKEGHDKKNPDIEKLKRQLETLKRENQRLRKRLERRRKR